MNSARALEPAPWAGSAGEEGVIVDDQDKRLTRLESDVKHIQSDVSDIKIEMRRTSDRVDTLNTKIDGVEKNLTARIDGVEKSLTAKIVEVDKSLTAKISEISLQIVGLQKDFGLQIVGLQKDFGLQIGGLREDLKAGLPRIQVWTFGLVTSMCIAILYMVARAFKWL
jgi:hypothetical protein